MSLYSIYDKMTWTKTQCHDGGKKRAETGARHPKYKFFVSDSTVLPDDYRHGVAGGKARQEQIRKQKEQQNTN